jgi:putative transposase
MEVTKTVQNKITSHGDKTFENTLCVFREALSFIVDIVNKEWNAIEPLTTEDSLTYVEFLIHRTKQNPSPKYDFDSQFYKFPSYFRRAAINKARGIVSSYQSNLNNWADERLTAAKEGKRFTKNPPKLTLGHEAFPTFYKGNMFIKLDETHAKIKVYKNNDWVWETITFNVKNMKNRGVSLWKEQNPSIVKKGRKYFLNFSYKTTVKLSNKKLKDQIIVAVDLGITNSAVCCAMTSDGTVLGRTFINQPKEKDRLFRLTNKLRKAQSISGWISAPNYWRQISGLQTQIINHTCHEILAFAKVYNADVIVFEYLDKMKTPKGFYGAKKLRFKLRYWRKTAIQKKVEEMAHYEGMRIRRINPRNTSALAFDGSGKVERSARKDLCTFTTGKSYHSDLNASYNIGARYFLKEYQKTTSEKKWLSLKAKVPELAKRTSQTLSSLITLHTVL